MTHMCRDENLIKTYNDKKDLYATVGSFIFHKDYWECMEHYEDGSPNPEGKKIRSKCKQVILGIMYGMGAKLMAHNIGVSIEECKEILEEFFKMFPAVKEFTTNNEKMAKENGYVEDYLGRQRHLPDAQIEELTFRTKKKLFTNTDVFLNTVADDSILELHDDEKNAEWAEKWKAWKNTNHRCSSYDSKAQFKELAKEENVDIMDNGAFISKSMTQCTNARIQGSAATLTKKAMVDIFTDPIMNKLGFKILIPVHDELLGECPIENSEAAEERLSYLMINAANPECSVGMKVDTYRVKNWYADEVSGTFRDNYIKAKSNGESLEDFLYKESIEYPEFDIETIKAMSLGEFDELSEIS